VVVADVDYCRPQSATSSSGNIRRRIKTIRDKLCVIVHVVELLDSEYLAFLADMVSQGSNAGQGSLLDKTSACRMSRI
jgi:hypothetical protein